MRQLVVARALAHSLSRNKRIRIEAVADSVAATIAAVASIGPEVVLCDSTLAGITDLIRQIRLSSMATAPIVLGAPDAARSITEYLDVGATGFVAATATLDEATAAIVAAAFGSEVRGHLECSLVLAPTPIRICRGRQTSHLTAREAQIGAMLARGMSNDEIAGRLAISHATVKQHVHAVLQKLGVSRRSEVASHYRIEEMTTVRPAESAEGG